MAFDYDSAIRKADLHIAEGRQRLIRQQELVERLEQHSHNKVVAEARKTQMDMEWMQSEFEQHAADLRRREDDNSKRRLMHSQSDLGRRPGQKGALI